MSANQFVPEHHRVEVDHTIGIRPGHTVFTNKDGPEVKTFKTSEITTEQEGLLVSVLLAHSIDTGDERFGFFIPHLYVPKGQTDEFCTIGAYEKFGGPDLIPHLRPATASTRARRKRSSFLRSSLTGAVATPPTPAS